MVFRLDQVGVSFVGGDQRREVLREVSFETKSGEFVSIVGPSGCGKTTLLRLLTGALKPDSGQLEREPEYGDGAGGALLVRQENSLFPWMTALDNTAFGLEMQSIDRSERQRLARAALGRFGLAEFENAYPRELSTGMKQRVALARAFVSRPAALLLDEPFGAVDAQTRLQLQQELLGAWSDAPRLGVVFVTHDVDEAILLSDRVFVLSTLPATIIETVGIPLPRPRPPATALDSRFLQIKRDLLSMLGVRLESPAHA